MKGRKPTLHADQDAIGDIKPPAWLSKFAKAEWRRVMPELSARKILTVADLGSLESYCTAMGHVRELAVKLRAGFDPKLFRAQNQAMVTARQLAAELGLTPISRSRPAVLENNDDADSLVD